MVGLRRRCWTPSTRTRLALAVVALGSLGLVAGCLPEAPPLGEVNRQQPPAGTPQWPILGDPDVVYDDGSYYVFSSNTTQFRLPIHRVTDLSRVVPDGGADGWFATTINGMPDAPPWADASPVLWAPTAIRAGGTYVLFFAANRADPPQPQNPQCIGRATASAPEGPYVAEPRPFSCGLEGAGGALDPSLFRDPDGSIFLLAAFGDTPDPIRVFSLDADADATRDGAGLATPSDEPLLGMRFDWEGGFIENPSMVYDPGSGTYLLAYSAGDWASPGYSTGLARCATPRGHCVSNPAGPWLASGNGRTGVGGLSFFTAADGSPKAAYASFAAGAEGPSNPRSGTVASVTLGQAPALGAP